MTAPSPDSNDRGNPPNQSGEDAGPAETSGKVVQTVECPNCGRQFVGNYCPECGEDTSRSISIFDLVGGFFRELVDVEQGFWPTFKGLTLRPGRTIQDFLGGVHRRLLSPGRYLLIAAVVGVGLRQLFLWLGITQNSAAPRGARPPTAETHQHLQEMSRTVWGESALMILAAVLLAGLFWLLFRGDSETDLREGNDALAVSCYLCAHGSVLSYLTEAVYRLSSHFSKALLNTGFSVLEVSDSVFLFLTLIYVSIATGVCFGPNLKSGLKGILAVVWALAELISITGAAIATYVLLANILKPEEYSRPWDGGVSPEAFLMIGVTSLILLFPLLAHLGAELYYRWR